MGVATPATALFTDNLPPATLRSLVPKIGNGSVFFIYGERGQPDEKPANTGFYAAARGPKEIWEVPDAEHMGGVDAHPQEYERRVVGFFDRALLKGAAWSRVNVFVQRRTGARGGQPGAHSGGLLRLS